MSEEAATAVLTTEQVGELVRQLDDLRRRLDATATPVTGERPSEEGSAPLSEGAPVPDTASLAPSAEPLALGLRTSLPSWLAAVLTDAEAALVQRDLAARKEEGIHARYWEARVAGLVGLGLERAIDEFDVEEVIAETASGEALGHHHGMLMGYTPPGTGIELETFRCQEETLLRLVGLSEELASQHYTAALQHYRRRGVVVHRDDLGRMFERACRQVDRLHVDLVAQHLRLVKQGSARAEDAERSVRTRKKVKLALTVLGGVLITVANTAAAPMLGPLTAPSLLLGGGAAGAVVNLLND